MNGPPAHSEATMEHPGSQPIEMKIEVIAIPVDEPCLTRRYPQVFTARSVARGGQIVEASR
jgi:hypothetical protein